MVCLRCGSLDRVKNGIIGGVQRFKCKGCGYQSVLDKPRGVDAMIKRQAVQLYLEGMGFRAIGRVLGVSNVSVLKWIRALGEKIEDLRTTTVEPAPAAVIVDEMWHFVHSKKDSSGAGLAFVIAHTRSSGSFVVIGQDAALGRCSKA
jgi:transposase-like protein